MASSSAPPSRAALLQNGGLYPIPVPLGWKLIDAQGEDVTIPAVESAPFHRILALGALLATEMSLGDPAEVMTLRRYPLPGPPSAVLLERYTKLVVDALSRQGLGPRVVSQQITACAPGDRRCGKLVVRRSGAADDRTEIHYLFCDQAAQTWELVYLLRSNNLGSWAPLLAEIDGPPASGA